ncbi:MAG: hypothetical protein IT342_26455 [Candidatus Melainabacteria bacterium]|nr:hypothetical protein [Candidatus Melainabacteria bacterium]
MKNKTTISMLAACMLGLFAVQANAAQVEEHSSWDASAPAAVQDRVNKSGKQTIVIVTDQNDCPQCGRMMQQFIYAQGDYPNIGFIGGTPEEWNVPKELLPYIVVVTPNCGVTKRMPNYIPANEKAIAYLVQHINDGAAEQPVTRTCK